MGGFVRRSRGWSVAPRHGRSRRLSAPAAHSLAAAAIVIMSTAQIWGQHTYACTIVRTHVYCMRSRMRSHGGTVGTGWAMQPRVTAPETGERRSAAKGQRTSDSTSSGNQDIQRAAGVNWRDTRRGGRAEAIEWKRHRTENSGAMRGSLRVAAAPSRMRSVNSLCHRFTCVLALCVCGAVFVVCRP